MRTRVVIGLVLLLAFLFSCNTEKNKELEIGIIYPLTGNASYWGRNASNGALLATDHFKGKNHLKGYTIKPIICNSKGIPKEALNCLNKLISQDNISFLIGDLVSSDLVAMMPIVNKNHIVTIGQGSSPLIKKPNDFVFRTFPSDDIQGSVIADYIKNFVKSDNIGILYINNDYGNGIKTVLLNKLKDKSTNVEGYSPTTRDFKDLIAKFRNLKEIVIIGYPEEVPILLKQLNEFDFNGVVIGTETFSNEKIIKGDYRYKVFFSSPQMSDSSNAAYTVFRENYIKKYIKNPGMPADMAYDAMRLMLNDIDSVGFNPDNVQRLLSTTKDFAGASGKITFDKNGDVIKPFTINEIINKKAKVIWRWSP